MKALLFFPASEYIADKWWHRLATVIFWIWVPLVTAILVVQAWDILEGIWYVNIYIDDDFDWNDVLIDVVLFLSYAASLFLPSVAYRVMLFIGTGSAWKGSGA